MLLSYKVVKMINRILYVQCLEHCLNICSVLRAINLSMPSYMLFPLLRIPFLGFYYHLDAILITQSRNIWDAAFVDRWASGCNECLMGFK